jgi:hypothetical protein
MTSAIHFSPTRTGLEVAQTALVAAVVLLAASMEVPQTAEVAQAADVPHAADVPQAADVAQAAEVAAGLDVTDATSETIVASGVISEFPKPRSEEPQTFVGVNEPNIPERFQAESKLPCRVSV